MHERVLSTAILDRFPMTRGIIEIHLIDPHTVPPDLGRSCLTHEEKSRAGRFRFHQDTIHWTACRASLRMILGQVIQLPPQEVPLIYLEFGKPALAPPYQDLEFNLSHCFRLAAIALSMDGPVGIDLESKERATDLLECASTFCHPAEMMKLPSDSNERSLELLRIWTTKEAILKALGTGLSISPVLIQTIPHENALGFSLDDSIINIQTLKVIQLTDPRLAGYQAFMSCCRSIREIKICS